MKGAACVASLLTVLLPGHVPSGVLQSRTSASEFVGTSPCGDEVRKFLGGMASGAACHAIAWRLTLTNPDAPPTWTLSATYGIPAPANPNQMVDGPKAAVEGTWEVSKGTKTNPAALVYRLKAGKPERSLHLARVADDLLQVLSEDKSLMVGTGGWSYTLNRADRAEKAGSEALASDMSYPISPRATGPVFGVFEGRTPCRGISRELNLPEIAGCIKVKWRVTLDQDPQTSVPTTYTVEGTLHRQRAREGTWSIVRGTTIDSSAVVYRLGPTNTEAALLLLRGDENVLFVLDRQHRPMIGNADFSYTLNRVTRSDSHK